MMEELELTPSGYLDEAKEALDLDAFDDDGELQHQMSNTWRSNLLPRSRFLELCVFKRMLAKGLHLTRHEGYAKPTTVFSDKKFTLLWWYNSLGKGYQQLNLKDILRVQTAIDPKTGSVRSEVSEISTISEDEYTRTFCLVAKKRVRTSTFVKESGAEEAVNDTDRAEIFIYFTCDSSDLYHLVLDGLDMLLEQSPSTYKSDENSDSAVVAAGHHERLGVFWRSMLIFHQLYRPEHHPNHPRPVIQNGVEVEVLYSGEYVVEFSAQLMRLPNPFFAPGMYCNGRVLAYDREADSYTIEYVNGPFEHDEAPDESKKNFPKGTVFSYVKRTSIIVDHRDNYKPRIPWGILLVSFIQFLVSISVRESPNDNDKLYQMQVGFFDDDCPDLRGQIWRLWTYQFVISSYGHMFFNLIVQIILGVPLDLVHGSPIVLGLYQLGVPMAALTVGYCVPEKIVSRTLSSFIGGTYAILGVHFGNLIINWNDMKHGLLSRWGRLGVLALIVLIEIIILSTDPDPETSPAMHAGGLLTGFLAGIVIFSNLNRTHFQRTYLIPMAKWMLCAFILFGLGWYIGFYPPRAVSNSFSALDADLGRPCCLKLLDCNIRRQDMHYFECVDDTRLTETDGATAVVKSQSCSAFKQYAGLQINA